MTLRYEVLIDHGETSNKCTILPVSYREDLSIRKFRRGRPIPGLKADILLHPDGVSLAELVGADSQVESLATIDCIWRRLRPIMGWLEKPLPKLVKIPDGFVTAYPRLSRLGNDPSGGLATIEAVFIAAAFVGKWDISLLSEYFFGEEFIQLNQRRFRDFGIDPFCPEGVPIYQPRFPRSAMTRRLGRGRAISTRPS